MTIKSEVLRIAHRHPNTRKHLVPLLRQAATLPSEESGGKPSHDKDFIAGFLEGQKYVKKHGDDSVDSSDAQKLYRKVQNKHGSWWIDGFEAAIDVARGATGTSGAQRARKLMRI